jgi:hypothetical protein
MIPPRHESGCSSVRITLFFAMLRKTQLSPVLFIVQGSADAAVPSDHFDTEMMNSVIGCGEY